METNSSKVKFPIKFVQQDKEMIKTGQEFNVLINNQNVVGDEVDLFFNGEDLFFVDGSVDMFDILVTLNVFTSKGEARKSWKKTQGKEIPEWFTDINLIGKRKIRITLLNLTEANITKGRNQYENVDYRDRAEACFCSSH